MIVHTGDTVRFIYEVLENQEYKFLFENLTILDIGCNIGAFSLYMQPLAKQIHAVDISEECIKMFDNTIKDNMYDNIKTYCFGISGKTGQRLIRSTGDPTEGGWRLEDIGDLMIDTYSLNDFMNKINLDVVDLVKLDVEGGEVEIVEAKDFPKDRINTIVGEYHTQPLWVRVKTALNSYNYRTMEVGGSHFIAKKI